MALYVGDLHPDVTESMLFERFSTAGTVSSVRVCRTRQTNQSMGYAYVNYNVKGDAERAMDTLNYETIKGRSMRIMWSHRDPDLRKSNVANVYIKNIDRSIDNQELYDTFLPLGRILSCKIAYDEKGESRGYGFVHFESEESARLAIEQVNGMVLKSKQVFVGKFIPKRVRAKLGDGLKMFNNVFVKNFAKSVDDEQLRAMFEQYGTITSVRVMRSEDGESLGFGFVTFTDPSGANAAVAAMNGFAMDDGQVLYAGAAEKKSVRRKELARQHDIRQFDLHQATNQNNMYVKNLSDSVNEEQLRKFFEKYGTVTSVKVMTDGIRPRGFGFVSLASPEEATRAITELNGKLLENKPLYVALAQTKEQRLLILAAQFKKKLADRSAAAANTLYPPTSTGGYFLPTMAQPQPFFGQTPVVRVKTAPRWAPQILSGRATTINPQMSVVSHGQPQLQQQHQVQQQIMPQQQQHQPQYYYDMNQQQIQQQPHQLQQLQPQPHLYRQPYKTSFRTLVSNNARNYPYPHADDTFIPSPSTQLFSIAPPQTMMPTPPNHRNTILSARMLADATPDEQKQLLGDELFRQIKRTHPHLANKITDKLLENDSSELLHLLDETQELQERIREVVELLR